MPSPSRRSGPAVRSFWKCPCCGVLVGAGSLDAGRRAFTRGALGNPLVIRTQLIVGRGHGDNNGPSIWRQRSMGKDELLHVQRALVRSLASVEERLDSALDEPESAEEVLASLDAEDFEKVSDSWLIEAETELENRRQLVEAERHRRYFGDD